MPPGVEQAIGQKLMLSFAGIEPSAEILAALKRQHVGGVALFRALNVENPAQVRTLTAALQQAAAETGQPPLLVAADQEGGQLMALGNGPTPFPGNLALGATGSEDLAQRVGTAIGRELAAMGINVNFAPVCDVIINPQNPVVGTRSFGEDPRLVARLSAAKIRGIQAAGVAATAKHFPGHGDTTLDSHDGTAGFLEPPSHLEPGAKVGAYTIGRILGRGGMGVVYLADDTRLHRPVALKALPPHLFRDGRMRARLRQEARAAAALSHPAIATVYALEEIDDQLFIASEYLEGRTLREELSAGAMPPSAEDARHRVKSLWREGHPKAQERPSSARAPCAS